MGHRRPLLEPAGSTVTMRRMEARTARRLAHATWLGTLATGIGELEVEAVPGSGTIVRGRIPTGRPA